jgi:DNA-binding NarL/FixJ family response regulator
VVIVEDHPLLADSLVIALGIQGYEASRIPVDYLHRPPAFLVAEVLRRSPDLVMLDLNLAHHGSGLDLISPLAASEVVVAVVTGDTNPARWGECLARGAVTVVPKCASLDAITDVVRRVAAGVPAMSEAQREALLAAWREQRRAHQEVHERMARLSRREAEVLGMLIRGVPVARIAQEWFVSVATVRTQVKAVLAKLEVSSQLAAVGLANEVGWRPPVGRPGTSSRTSPVRRARPPGQRPDRAG